MFSKVICRKGLARSADPRGRVFITLRALCAAQQHVLRDCHSGLQLIATKRSSTALLAHYFATVLRPGDCYLLHGEVGAGKSFFSRAFIRAAMEDDALSVPSPTFLLQNIYAGNPDSPALHHFDLYRLTNPLDLARLDLPQSLSSAVSLIEWADRLPEDLVPDEFLRIKISIAPQVAACVSRAQNVEDIEEDENAEVDNEESNSGDRRWRRIDLLPHGSAWQSKVDTLRRHITARGPPLGLHLCPPP